MEIKLLGKLAHVERGTLIASVSIDGKRTTIHIPAPLHSVDLLTKEELQAYIVKHLPDTMNSHEYTERCNDNAPPLL